MKKITPWTIDLSVGNGRLDGQHMELFRLTNEASSLLDTNSNDVDKTYQVVNDIAELLFKHFAAEEEVLAHNGCPHLAKHVAEHSVFQSQLVKILDRADDQDLDATALVSLMADWMNNHVLQMDLLCKDYLVDNRRRSLS